MVFLMFGFFLSPYLKVNPGDMVVSKRTRIYIVANDTSITSNIYGENGYEMIWHAENKSGQGDYIFRFSPDSFHVLKEMKIRHEVSATYLATDFRFAFEYISDTVLTRVRISSFDTLESEDTYHRDATGRLDRISTRFLRPGTTKRSFDQVLSYDGFGRLSVIKRDTTTETRIHYNAGGLVSEKIYYALPSGTVDTDEKYSYDSEGRILRIEEYQGGSLISVDTYEYELLENVLGINRRKSTIRNRQSVLEWERGALAYNMLGQRFPVRNVK